MKRILFFLIPAFLICLNLQAQEIQVEAVTSFEAGFNYPTDLHGLDDAVFVLDGMNDRVVKLSLGKQAEIISPQRETIQKSVGICIQNGNLWIADTPRKRIVVFNQNGRVIDVFELNHGTEPVGLTVVNDAVAVSDRSNHAIQVIEFDGSEKYFWGKRGSEVGEFINPGFLATGPENRLIIGDMLNRRVMSYSPSGRFPQIVVKPGIERGQSFRPKGVALDSKDRVWVVDGYTGSLQAFRISSNFLGVAVSEGEQVDLKTPMGIWIDSEDRIWIVESMANRVSVWQIKG